MGFFGGKNERWSKEDVIAARAIDAALRGVGEDIFLEHGLANSFCDVLFFGEWLARGFVFHEFDTKQKADAADFADVGMGCKRSERFAKFFRDDLHASEEILFLQHVENRVTDCSGDGMGLVGEAMLECAGTFFESFGNARRDKNGAERRVPARDAFADENQIRLCRSLFGGPVLNGERSSGAAHACHDLVGYEQNSVFAAYFRDALRVAIRRSGSTESRANDWLKDESRDGPSAVC